MKKAFSLLLICVSFAPVFAWSAILHFYNHPRLPQAIYHVGIEYQGHFYEADTREGGRKILVTAMKELGHSQIEIPDILVDEELLHSQLGWPFDYEFRWDNQKTYCSELVGIALNIPTSPVNFANTHYLRFYPDWIHRRDPGISPDAIWLFGLKHGRLLQHQIPGLPTSLHVKTNF